MMKTVEELEKTISLLKCDLTEVISHANACCDFEMLSELAERLEGLATRETTELNTLEAVLDIVKVYSGEKLAGEVYSEEQYELMITSLEELLGPPSKQSNGTEKQPANQSLNNGGETNYYDLPPESSRPCIDDLIEFKKMQRWQAEVFKSSYAIADRAKRATDGSSSESRELNKMVYYVNRRLKQLGEEVYYVKD